VQSRARDHELELAVAGGQGLCDTLTEMAVLALLTTPLLVSSSHKSWPALSCSTEI
jgi:hypothetical protein